MVYCQIYKILIYYRYDVIITQVSLMRGRQQIRFQPTFPIFSKNLLEWHDLSKMTWSSSPATIKRCRSSHTVVFNLDPRIQGKNTLYLSLYTLSYISSVSRVWHIIAWVVLTINHVQRSKVSELLFSNSLQHGDGRPRTLVVPHPRFPVTFFFTSSNSQTLGCVFFLCRFPCLCGFLGCRKWAWGRRVQGVSNCTIVMGRSKSSEGCQKGAWQLRLVKEKSNNGSWFLSCTSTILSSCSFSRRPRKNTGSTRKEP